MRLSTIVCGAANKNERAFSGNSPTLSVPSIILYVPIQITLDILLLSRNIPLSIRPVNVIDISHNLEKLRICINVIKTDFVCPNT